MHALQLKKKASQSFSDRQAVTNYRRPRSVSAVAAPLVDQGSGWGADGSFGFLMSFYYRPDPILVNSESGLGSAASRTPLWVLPCSIQSDVRNAALHNVVARIRVVLYLTAALPAAGALADAALAGREAGAGGAGGSVAAILSSFTPRARSTPMAMIASPLSFM